MERNHPRHKRVFRALWRTKLRRGLRLRCLACIYDVSRSLFLSGVRRSILCWPSSRSLSTKIMTTSSVKLGSWYTMQEIVAAIFALRRTPLRQFSKMDDCCKTPSMRCELPVAILTLFRPFEFSSREGTLGRLITADCSRQIRPVYPPIRSRQLPRRSRTRLGER